MQCLNLFQQGTKELRELQSNYPLALDKIEIKIEMLSEYQLKVADLYPIPIDNHKDKYVLHYENLQLYLRLRLRLKKYIVY